MTSEPDTLIVHVAVISGNTFNGKPIPPELIAESINSKTKTFYLPWKDSSDQHNLQIVSDPNEAASIGRELAVASGWDDEALIVIYLSDRHTHGIPTPSAASKCLSQISAYAKSYGVRIVYKITSIDLGADVHRTTEALAFIETISQDNNIVYHGPISRSQQLVFFIQRNKLLCNLCNKVAAALADVDIEPVRETSCADLVNSYIEGLRDNGFVLSPKDENSLNTLALRISLTANERYAGNIND